MLSHPPPQMQLSLAAENLERPRGHTGAALQLDGSDGLRGLGNLLGDLSRLGEGAGYAIHRLLCRHCITGLQTPSFTK